MPVAIKAAVIIAALACCACGSRSGVATNSDVATNSGMDVETLPPDESDTTPTNELQNGVDEPTDATPDLNSD